MNQKKAGVLLSYGQTALSTLISLTYTPVMLRLLGQSEYGLYTLVNGFVSNLSLLSFGMGSAYMRYYSRAEVQDGEEGVARINGMFMTIFFVGRRAGRQCQKHLRRKPDGPRAEHG